MALASPALSAFVGAFVRVLGDGLATDYRLFGLQWFVANALGNLTLGRVVLTWLADGGGTLDVRSNRIRIEVGLLALGLVAACAGAFWLGAGLVPPGFLPALICLPLPIILWASIRFGARGASGAILILTLVSIWSTLSGASPFVGTAPEENVLALQLFLIGVAIPVLLLGAARDELWHAHRRTRALSSAVLGAQEDERRRIARGLHDSTGQNSVAATLLMSRIRPSLQPAGRPLFQELEGLLEQSMRELRTASHFLHPPLLDEAGLALALQNHTREFSERSGVEVILDVCADLERLSAERELALFRLVQEALSNVSRHSGSVTANVSVTREKAKHGYNVVVTIEDTGRGMPKPTTARGSLKQGAGVNGQRGIGLASMRERFRQLGGRLAIESKVGRTIVRATVPIDDNAAVGSRL